MIEFNVGDRVRVINPPAWLYKLYKGEGVITELYASPVRHGVSIDGSPAFYFEIDKLELIVDKPAFVVGDTVEYKVIAKVTAVFPTGVIQIYRNDDNKYASVSLDEQKNMIKLAPPFPTRVGSAILALGPAGVNNKLYFRVADSEFPWHSPAVNDSFHEHELELISIEYAPGD